MITFILMGVAFATPEPASFKLNIEASKFTDYAVYWDRQKIVNGETYYLDPFIGSKKITIEVVFVDGDCQRRKRLCLELIAGRHREWNLQIPRVFPSIGICRTPPDETQQTKG